MRLLAPLIRSWSRFYFMVLVNLLLGLAIGKAESIVEKIAIGLFKLFL